MKLVIDPCRFFTLDDQHSKVRKALNLSREFVIHSLRHTMLTRLGESGVDAFEIMRIAGHSTVTVSQRYMHPSPESLERAFERLENMNQQAKRRLAKSDKRRLPATIPATLDIPINAGVS